MLKLKTALLCSALSVSLWGGAHMAYALSQYPRDTRETLKKPHIDVGAYVEIGGSMGVINILDVTSANTSLNTFTKTTIKSTDMGFSGTVGIRIHGLSLGIEGSHFTAPIAVKPLAYDFGGGNSNPGDDEETIGNVDMSMLTAKITGEYSLDGHNTLYGFGGLGGVLYDIEDEKATTHYSSKHIRPAFVLGAGYKLYTEQNKGLYLSIGGKYTGVFNNQLKTSASLGQLDLSGWLGMTQFELKLGYQF